VCTHVCTLMCFDDACANVTEFLTRKGNVTESLYNRNGILTEFHRGRVGYAGGSSGADGGNPIERFISNRTCKIAKSDPFSQYLTSRHSGPTRLGDTWRALADNRGGALSLEKGTG
jgi:hypothetical protein